jgi:hypothetical protein
MEIYVSLFLSKSDASYSAFKGKKNIPFLLSQNASNHCFKTQSPNLTNKTEILLDMEIYVSLFLSKSGASYKCIQRKKKIPFLLLQWTSDNRTSDIRTLAYKDTPKHVPAKVVLCYPRLLIRTLTYKDTKMLVPAVSLYPRFTVQNTSKHCFETQSPNL